MAIDYIQTGAPTADEVQIIEQWESMSTGEWKKDRVNTSVAVCKIVPDGICRCPIHRETLQKKQLGVRAPDGGVVNVSGLFCSSCMDFFVEQKNATSVAKNLSKRHIPAWIQPLPVTLSDWEETVEPIPIDNTTPIYIPDTWVEGKEQCPLHPEQALQKDSFVKWIEGQSLRFDAWYCPDCGKILLRNAEAQELQDQAAAMGFPPLVLSPLRAERKAAHQHRMEPILPDYFLWGERIISYGLNKAADWDRLTEEETIVIGETQRCPVEDHKTEKTLALLTVEKKRAGQKRYLLCIGYCSECDRYYLAEQDFQLIATDGRVAATIVDDTGNIAPITSGQEFLDERGHLQSVEDGLDRQIRAIKSQPGYVERYATTYYYDDGNLKDAKRRSADWHNRVAQIDALKPQPYKTRVDLIAGDETQTYYLGLNEIAMEGVPRVDSSLSKLGRDLSNYRTTEITLERKKWKVRRRREFDIERQVLYSYLEQSDEDFLFQHGITDPFLREVLKQRKRHHQLVDIISTIQENQNQIIDEPYDTDLIVQGCAGSGKTMVLLHRLSFLKQDDSRHFDAGSTVILTPNSNFNTHINGLAASLQLGMIPRYPVEEYYRRLLREYDTNLAGTLRLADEMTLDKEVVRYLYSDIFLFRLTEAYEEQLSRFESLWNRLGDCAEHIQLKRKDTFGDTGAEMVQSLQREVSRIGEEINQKESEYRRAEQNLEKLKERNNNIRLMVDKDRQQLTETTSRECKNATDELNQLISNHEGADRIGKKAINGLVSLIERQERNCREAELKQEEIVRATAESAMKQASGVLEAKQIEIQTMAQAMERYEERLKNQRDDERILIDELDNQMQETKSFLMSTLLQEEEKLRKRFEEYNRAVEEKREEYRSLERRILVTRKQEKMAALQNEIDRNRTEREDAEQNLQLVHKTQEALSKLELPEEVVSIMQTVSALVEGISERSDRLGSQIKRTSEAKQRTKQLQEETASVNEKLEMLQRELAEMEQILQTQRVSMVQADTFPNFLNALKPMLPDLELYRERVLPCRKTWRNEQNKLTEYKKELEQQKLLQAIRKRMLSKLHVLKESSSEALASEDTDAFFEALEGSVETLDEHRQAVRAAKRKLETDLLSQKEILESLQKAEVMMSSSRERRVSPELQVQYSKIRNEIAALDAKKIYDSCYDTAMERTIRELAATHGRQFSMPHGTYRFDLYLRLKFAMRYYGRPTGTDHLICIDEGQDLAKNEYKLIRDINDRSAVFNIYGDTNQLLRKERGIEDWTQVRELLPTAKQYELNENYRNTNQITQYCNDTFHMTVAKTGTDGRKVKEIDRSHFAEALGKLTLRDDRVAIILPRAVEKQKYLDGEKLPKKISNALGNEIGNGRITLAYVDEVKGVEFDNVFVVPNGMNKNEKYIAFTRALSSLTLVVDRTIPDYAEENVKENVATGAEEKQKADLMDYRGIKVGKVVKRKRS